MDDLTVGTESSAARSGLYGSLLLEARTLFCVQGYRATSTRDIAERAGASEALLFRHFGSKDRLFEQAVVSPFHDVVRSYLADAGPRHRGAGAVSAVQRELSGLFALMTRHRALFRALIATSGIQDGPAVADGDSPVHALVARVERLLRGACRQGTRVLDLEITARAVVALVMAAAVLDDWLFDRHADAPSARRIADEVTALVRYGCVARPSTEPSVPRRGDPLPPLAPRTLATTDSRPRERTKNRQRRSRHEVRKAVLAAANELFSAKGYAGTTTQEIAALAQVSETSVFRHFGSKRNLFEHAIVEPFRDWTASYLASWDRSNRTPNSLEQQTRHYVAHTYDTLIDNRGLIRSMIATSTLEPDGAPRVDTSEPPLQEIFLRLEDQMADLAARNQLLGLDIAVTIRATFGMILALAILPDWMFDGAGSVPPRTRLVNEVAALITFGLGRV